MHTEQQQEALTATVLELSGRAFVVDVLLDAIISTHPLPHFLADVFQHLLESQTEQLDAGFPPETTPQGRESVHRAVQMFSEHYLRRVQIAAGAAQRADS